MTRAGGLRLAPVALATAILWSVLAAPALADSPTGRMRDYTNEVLTILQQAAAQETDRVAAARAAVRKAAIEIFGLAEAAREVLGVHWEARTAAEREEFVQLFADLLEATYISQMDRHRGVKVRYVGESIQDDRADVRGKVVTRSGDEMALEVRLFLRDDRWLVYDVTFDGISLVGNYRAQFDRIMRRSSYAELVRQLKAKRDGLLGRKGAPPG